MHHRASPDVTTDVLGSGSHSLAAPRSASGSPPLDNEAAGACQEILMMNLGLGLTIFLMRFRMVCRLAIETPLSVRDEGGCGVSASIVERFRVIDTDTHLVEPPDLWTSRMSSRWGDLVPRVVGTRPTSEEAWFIGDQRVAPVGVGRPGRMARVSRPTIPRRWSDADPRTWEAKARLARMDEYGIFAQVLYPNVALFNSALLQEADDLSLPLELLRAYNDYQTDWASAAPDRLLPMTCAAVLGSPGHDRRRWTRCAAAGHRGIVFSQDPGAFGLPGLTDRLLGPDVGGGPGDGPAGQLPHRVGRHVAAGQRRPS